MGNATRAEHGERAEFRNTTNAWQGAIQYAPNGSDEKSVAVEPLGTIWLSDAEQELTAKSHRDKAKNPFEPQPFEVRDPETDEVVDSGMRPVFVINEEERPIPGTAHLRPEAKRAVAGTPVKGGASEARARKGDAPDGSRDDREEVDTPAAEKPAARRRRRTAAKA